MPQRPLNLAVVAGGTGLVGQALVGALLQQGVTVRVLTRRPQASPFPNGVQAFSWERVAEALVGADAVFNLAGEGIADRRWTADRKALLRVSRIDATHRITEAIGQMQARPKVLINASAIGYYGPRGEEALDESAPAGTGFLAETCQAWEAAADEASALGLRVAKLRIGVVLARQGGALTEMARPVRLFAGTALGSGVQGLSWIHLQDLASLFIEAARNPTYEGAVNATAPEPLSNRAFTVALARQLRRPLWPVPAFLTRGALRLLVGEMAEPLLLSGAYIWPRKAETLGFQFDYPTLAAALAELLP